MALRYIVSYPAGTRSDGRSVNLVPRSIIRGGLLHEVHFLAISIVLKWDRIGYKSLLQVPHRTFVCTAAKFPLDSRIVKTSGDVEGHDLP